MRCGDALLIILCNLCRFSSLIKTFELFNPPHERNGRCIAFPVEGIIKGHKMRLHIDKDTVLDFNDFCK